MNNKIKIREAVKELNPIDDLMFRKMAEERAFCEEILRVILRDANLTVIDHHAQDFITNLQGRSVILDARCLLGDKRTVNIEVQRSDDDDHQKRVRYNGAVLTANITDPGLKFKAVPDVCVIFISRFDIFKGGLPLYHVVRSIEETGQIVHNGFEEIYVNAAARDDSPVSELMDVFTNDHVYSDKFPVTSSMKYRYKETQEGQMIMSSLSELLVEEGRVQGRAEGRVQGRAEGIHDVNALNILLIKENRWEDLKRASNNPAFQAQLIQELFHQPD